MTAGPCSNTGMALLARDLVQPEPVTFPPDTPLPSLLHVFVAAQIGCAPIVDGRGAVVGLVSTTDLLRVIDQLCDDDVDAGERGRGGLDRLTAADAATPSPVWVAPDTPIAQVAALMRDQGIHSVLVGAGGALVGVLTSFDLLAVAAGHAPSAA